MKNSFFLTIPPQAKNPEELAEFESSVLQTWLDDLPAANYGLTARLLHERIKQLNRLEAEPLFRLNALETLRPGVMRIEEYLRARLSVAGFPLDENQRKVGQLLVSITKEFSTGYWGVAQALSGRESGWLQGKHLATSLQRVIRGLSGVLIAHYMMAIPVPSWVWLDLHALYRLGQSKNKASTKVKDAGSVYCKTTSVEDSYKQILLLSLADPQGLMQKEVPGLYTFCEMLTGHLHVDRNPAGSIDQRCLLLVDEDRSPAWGTYRGGEDLDSTVYVLEMGKLVHHFKKQIARFVELTVARFGASAMDSLGNGFLAPELADYLAARWSGIPIDGDAYFGDRLDRLFSSGLKATHQHLSPASATDEGGVAPEWVVETASDRTLSCRFDRPGQIFIGSLVSFRRADADSAQRALGTVCRIHMEKPDGPVNFQVRLLTGEIFAVGTQPLKAKDPTAYQRTLLYVEQTGGENKTYLILESQKLKEGETIRLLMQNDSFPILLQNRKNVGLGYWQFECQRVANVRPEEVVLKKGYDFV